MNNVTVPLDDRHADDVTLVAMLWRYGHRGVRCGSPLGLAAEHLDADGLVVYSVDTNDLSLMHVTFPPREQEAH